MLPGTKRTDKARTLPLRYFVITQLLGFKKRKFMLQLLLLKTSSKILKFICPLVQSNQQDMSLLNWVAMWQGISDII